MVARNYDRCVLVEILLLNPGNELGDLLAGAVQNRLRWMNRSILKK